MNFTKSLSKPWFLGFDQHVFLQVITKKNTASYSCVDGSHDFKQGISMLLLYFHFAKRPFVSLF